MDMNTSIFNSLMLFNKILLFSPKHFTHFLHIYYLVLYSFQCFYTITFSVVAVYSNIMDLRYYIWLSCWTHLLIPNISLLSFTGIQTSEWGYWLFCFFWNLTTFIIFIVFQHCLGFQAQCWIKMARPGMLVFFLI